MAVVGERRVLPVMAARRLAKRCATREHVIAALIAEGLSGAEIAERPTLTPGTVGNHLAHIMRRLGSRNRVQVAVWAVAHGLYRPEDPS